MIYDSILGTIGRILRGGVGSSDGPSRGADPPADDDGDKPPPRASG